MRTTTLQQTLNSISQGVFGTATVGGSVWTWLDDRAGVIGLLFTFVSLVIFATFSVLGHRLKLKEHAIRVREMEFARRAATEAVENALKN